MNRWLALLLACVALSLVVAGCGGDDKEEPTGGAQNTEEPSESHSAEGVAGGGTEVAMEGIKFAPASVSVKAGDTVTWTNNDTVGHDVTGDSFKSGEPGAMENSDTYENTFKKAGTFEYVCTVHPGMEGAVTVK